MINPVAEDPPFFRYRTINTFLMTQQKVVLPQTIFWTVCAVLVAWATVTLVLELRMGWPVDRAAWGHRLIGWFVNFLLIRTFLRGMKRYFSARTAMEIKR
jgi:hypothetical protein